MVNGRPRTRIADIINNLTQLGALVIGFDAVEPDRLNPEIAADTFRGLDEATRKLRALPSNDQILADTIRQSRVVLGESGGPDVHADLDMNLPVTGFAMLGENPLPFIYKFKGLLRNTRVLEEAATGRGLFTIVPERDGIIRRVPMIMQAQGVTMPSLSFEMLRVVSGSGTILTKTDKAGILSIGIKGFQVPTDANGQLWVHYADRDPSLYVSAVDVLDGLVPQDKIKGKLILIGTSSTGLNDIKTTPVSPAMPGVEIHAQVLESALTGAVVSQPNHAIALELLGALVLGLLVIAFAPKFGPITLFAVGAMLASLLVGTSWYFYAVHRLLVDFTYPLMSTTAIYLTLIFASFVRRRRSGKQIRGQFAQYMSPVLVEQLAQSPEKLKLGGEEREFIMFSDVRGLTTISESYKNDPQGLTALMNRFRTPLTNAILARKGYIDKYMGDAIMAFWNALLDDKEHEINACEAALDMLEKIDELNTVREPKPGKAGILHPDQLQLVSTPASAWSGIWARAEVQLFGARRQRQSGLLAWKGNPRNTASIIAGSKNCACGQGPVRDPRGRFRDGQGQEGARGHLRRRQDVAQSAHFQRLRNLTIEMLALSQPRLGWHARGDRARAQDPRGRKPRLAL